MRVLQTDSRISINRLLIWIVFSIGICILTLSIPGQDSRKLEREKSQSGLNNQEKRTALVIGNSDYLTSPLANPKNDAEDLTAVLRDLDFEVISNVNHSRADMIRAIREFGDRLREKRGGQNTNRSNHRGYNKRGRNGDDDMADEASGAERNRT